MAKISKTKQRILDSAKRLFNDQRYGNVTIKEIAADLGISTGNVWYHYKDKREILRGLNEEFLVAAKQRMALLPSGGAVIPEFGHFIAVLNAEIRDYRFMYRDQADYGEHTEILREALPDIYGGTLGQVQAFLAEMHAQGVMAIKQDDIRQLSEVVVSLARYALEFYRESAVAGPDEMVAQSINAQCFILNRFLSPEVAEQLRQALEESFVQLRPS